MNHLPRYLIALLLVLLGLSLSPAAVQGQEGIGPSLDVVVLVDESGSIWRDTDAGNFRRDAFNMLVNVYGAYDTSSPTTVRMAVVAYGSTDQTQVVMPFTPVNPQTVEGIKSRFATFQDSLRGRDDGPGLGWTDALRALELAEAQFVDPVNGHLRSHKPVIIILTDGKPETEEINETVDGFETKLEAYLERIYAQAARLRSDPGGPFYYDGVCPSPKPGWVPIYTVGVGEGASVPARYNAIWQQLADQNGGVYLPRPESLDRTLLQDTYLKLYHTVTCLPGEGEIVIAPIVKSFEVTDTYAAIKFTIVKTNPEIGVAIYRPGSSAPLGANETSVTALRSPLDEVWSIVYSEPWAGTWRVELSGEGEVLFDYTTVPAQIHVNTLQPTDHTVRACAPVDISLAIINSLTGDPFTSEVESLALRVILPNGSEQDLGVVTPQGDLFNYQYGANKETCTDGTYEFRGTFTLKEGAGEVGWSYLMNSTLDPRMEIISPPADARLRTSEVIPLIVDLKLGDRSDDALAASNPPVTAMVYRDGREYGAPYTLRYDGASGPSRMRAEIPANSLEPGSYTITYQMDAPRVREVEILTSTFTVEVGSAPAVTPTSPPTVTPLPTATPVPAPLPELPPLESIFAVLGVAGVGGLAALGYLFFRQMPRMPLLSYRDNQGMEQLVQGGLGGRRPTRQTFFTADGQPVQLEFSPTHDADGQEAIAVRLLSDPPVGPEGSPASVRVEGGGSHDMLDQRGQSALITRDAQSLVVGKARYDLQHY